MQSGKALALGEWCAGQGITFTALDCFAHGESSGDFMDFTIGRAIESALHILDEVCVGPQLLVGSSMGGWVALHVALQRREKIAGLVGIAAAPDFTDRMRPMMTSAQQAELDREGVVWAPGDFGPDYPITQHFLDDGRAHCLLTDRIPLDIPVQLIQGMRDDAVPWETALAISEKLTSADVAITLIKDGEHRLNREGDLAAIKDAVGKLVGG
jgi:pimeloyl-ACP methyl ester carboxylesterase